MRTVVEILVWQRGDAPPPTHTFHELAINRKFSDPSEFLRQLKTQKKYKKLHKLEQGNSFVQSLIIFKLFSGCILAIIFPIFQTNLSEICEALPRNSLT